MKSKKVDGSNICKEYPKLMVHSQTPHDPSVVLFYKPYHGILVHCRPDSRYYLGEEYTTTSMSWFTDYTGHVNLSN